MICVIAGLHTTEMEGARRYEEQRFNCSHDMRYVAVGRMPRQKMQDEIVIPVAEEETGREDTAREVEDLGGADTAITKDTVCADDAVVIEMGPEKNLQALLLRLCCARVFSLDEKRADHGDLLSSSFP